MRTSTELLDTSYTSDSGKERERMDYEKRVMKLTELEKVGFSRRFLLKAYRRKGQSYAWKMSAASNSPILFDTEKFEKWRKSQTKVR